MRFRPIDSTLHFTTPAAACLSGAVTIHPQIAMPSGTIWGSASLPVPARHADCRGQEMNHRGVQRWDAQNQDYGKKAWEQNLMVSRATLLLNAYFCASINKSLVCHACSEALLQILTCWRCYMNQQSPGFSSCTSSVGYQANSC